MALTANRDVDHYVDQEIRSLPVAGTVHIYKGALLASGPTGYAQAASGVLPFVGIAYEEMDNSSGADGALSVRVYTVGDFGMTLTGAATSDLGRPVFVSADDTLTFTGSGASYVGIVQDVVAANEIVLRIDPGRNLVKTITHAVEDVSAGVDISDRTTHAFDRSAWIVAARIVNQATAAAGIDNSNTCVINLLLSAGLLVTQTFDASTAFPGVNTRFVMTGLANVHVTAADVLLFSMANGATADPGPFLVEIDYV